MVEAALAEVQGWEGAEDDTEPEFLTKPRLDWTPPLQPTFVSRVCNIPYLELDSSTYALVVADESRAQLLRQEDGTYRLEPDEPLRLPLTHTSWRAELLDDLGETDVVMELRLWEPEDELTVFELPGRSC